MTPHTDQPVESGAHQLDSLDQDHGPHLRNLPTSNDAVSGVAYPASEPHQSLWGSSYNPQSSAAESYYPSLSSDPIGQQPLEYSFNYPDQHPMTPQLHEDSSPALPTTPMDSLPSTPNYPPSRDHMLYNAHIQSNVQMEGSPFIGAERPPNLFVDTSLLRPESSSNSTYGNNQQEYSVSPGLLSPYSAGSNNPSPLREQVDMQGSPLENRHKHSQSVEDARVIIGHSIQRGGAPGLTRARSVPTSRQSSPYSYSGSGSNVNSPRSAASNNLSLGGGFYFPPDGHPPPSPTDSEQVGQRRAVTTPKIRQASSGRRKYPANIKCDVLWCEDTFTTNFAKDRHMKSHSGQRDHACTIPGCDKRFTTDSGRKRHERSTTLHRDF